MVLAEMKPDDEAKVQHLCTVTTLPRVLLLLQQQGGGYDEDDDVKPQPFEVEREDEYQDLSMGVQVLDRMVQRKPPPPPAKQILSAAC
jgi:hypothetical protein